MELTVERAWPKETYTIGKFFINGKRFSETCEDRDRGLLDSMSITEIKAKKVYGETAIPKGRYEIKMTYSPKFANREWAKKYGGRVIEIMSVKGYSGIRIHPFNTAKESLGCIAVGKNTVKGQVTQSTAYYKKLVDEYVYPALKRGEKVYITIR